MLIDLWYSKAAWSFKPWVLMVDAGDYYNGLVKLLETGGVPWTMDLANARVDNTEFLITLTMSNGVSRCSCGLRFNGTESSGTCDLSTACTYIPGSGSDPVCALNSGNGFGMCGGTGGYTYDGTHFSFDSGAIYH